MSQIRAAGRDEPPGRRTARVAAAAALLLLLLASGLATEASSRVASASASRPPENSRPPSIAGTPQVGHVLRASNGRWRRERGLVFAYQWRTCSGTACTDVAGANDRIYAVRSEDTTKAIVVVVTATNGDGASKAPSRATLPVIPQKPRAPSVQEPPTVAGKTEPGATLTAQSGTWQGDTPLEFEYRWRRCTALGGACEELARAKQTYALTAKDRGHRLRVLVRAENSAGTGSSLSDATALIPGPTPASPPKSTSPPLVTGAAAEGKTLTSSSGSWSGTTPMQFSFQWRRCDKSGAACAAISGATHQTYTLVERDVARTIRARVTARNAAGASSVTSDRTAVVTGAAAPANTRSPMISGAAREGSVLTTSSGSWRGSQPISFSYQWLRCGAGGGGCAAIPSAAGRTRALTSGDVGKTLRARVTATNGGGSSAAVSPASAVVASRGKAPANTAGPLLSGSARQGARLGLSTGSWTGTQPLSFSYRWERCDGAVRNCRTIDGATASAYVLTRADVGHRLRGVVTARNSAGSSSAGSNATAVVVGAPASIGLPQVRGEAVEGRTLLATPGQWTGVGPITFGYQWTRCNAQGEFASCVPVVVTSRPTYTLRAADVGRRIFAQVKARNAYGASFVNSELTGVVAAAPIGSVTIRAVRGVIVSGQVVTLVGRVVGAPAGERVDIVVRPARSAARVRQNAAVIGPAGTWRFVAQPSIGTTYEARFRGRASRQIVVQVRPRLLLRKTGSRRALIRVFAGRSFAGKSAFLQRWSAKRHRWITAQRVRLRAGRPATVTVATIRLRTPRGAYVRVVLPGRRAGVGYVTGTSNRVRG